MKKIITLVVALLLSGCASKTIDYGEQSINLELGMSKSQVTAIMGLPKRTDVNEKRERWVYWNKTSYGLVLVDHEMLAGDKLTVTFEDGKVTGWNQNAYLDDAAEMQKEMMESFGDNVQKINNPQPKDDNN